MADVEDFEKGGYRFIRAVFQYSSGVAAMPGFEIERAVLRHPIPLGDGFALVEAHLKAIGRPCTSFAACELRSPEPFTERGFYDFNREYVTTLERWNIFKDGLNPVARTNVCPEHGKPAEPSLFAFSYTVPAGIRRQGSFIIAGGAEMKNEDGAFRDQVMRYGEVSSDAIREKVRFVVDSMEHRLKALGFSWKDAASTQAYTVQNIGELLAEEFAARGTIERGLTWHFSRPPVIGLEFEMDVRGTARDVYL